MTSSATKQQNKDPTEAKEAKWVVVKVWQGQSAPKSESIHNDAIAQELGHKLQQWTTAQRPLQSFLMVSVDESQPMFGYRKHVKFCLLYFPLKCSKQKRNRINFTCEGAEFVAEFIEESYRSGHIPKQFEDAHGKGIYYKYDTFSGSFFRNQAPNEPPDALIHQCDLDQALEMMTNEFDQRIFVQDDMIQRLGNEMKQLKQSYLEIKSQNQVILQNYQELSEKFEVLLQENFDMKRQVEDLKDEAKMPQTPQLKKLKVSDKENAPKSKLQSFPDIQKETGGFRYYNNS